MAHGGQAELGVGHALKRDEVRVLVDALHILATTSAGGQYRRVLVRRQRQHVQLVPRPRAELLENRQPLGKHIGLQVDIEQFAQPRIAGIQVHPAAIRNVQGVFGKYFGHGRHGVAPTCFTPRLGEGFDKYPIQ
ncbi:hypothetical protein D3C81_1646760 [compost metagenome]